MVNKQLLEDKIIVFAVMIQPILIVLQTVMTDLFNIPESKTTIYRVVLTAIPMSVAIMIAFVRSQLRFLGVYFLVALLLMFTVLLHPDNTPFVMNQGLRFLMPVVLSSFLCLSVVRDSSIVEKILYIISWIIFALVSLLLYGFFTGKVYFTSYNMGLSFACVLPFVVFYYNRNIFDIVASVVLFLFVLATGARGPLLCMLVYVILDLFQRKSRWRIVFLILIIAFVVFLPMLDQWLGTIGVSSRTLRMLSSGEIAQDSGRSSIRNYFIQELMKHPLIGLGLFGDRLMDDVPYCHSLILEIIIDFGILVGPMIIIYLLVKLVSIYRSASMERKNQIIRYFCAFALPFLTSGSYLIDSGFAVFVGLCFLYNNEQRKKDVWLAER